MVSASCRALATLAVLATASIGLAACNTVTGMGQDASAVGHDVSKGCYRRPGLGDQQYWPRHPLSEPVGPHRPDQDYEPAAGAYASAADFVSAARVLATKQRLARSKSGDF